MACRASRRSVLSEATSSIPAIILTINTILSILRAREHPRTVAFIAFAYTDLMLLFGCIHSLEQLRHDGPSEKKERLLEAIWLLATAINVMFACRASEILPWGMAAVIWAMAAFASLTGFCVLYVRKLGRCQGEYFLPWETAEV